MKARISTMRTMKALTVNFDLVIQAMRDWSRLNDDFFLDKATGKVLVISRMLIRSLEQDRRDESHPVARWDAQLMPVARDIVLGGSAQYTRIPEAYGLIEHKWMAAFAKDVKSFRIKQKLIVALRGRGSCQRFKDILKEAPEENRRWSAFRQARWEERIQSWLEPLGILAVNARPSRVRASE